MADKTQNQLHKSRQTQLFITHQMAHRSKQKKLKPQMSINKVRLKIGVKFWSKNQHHKSKSLLVLDLHEQLSVLT